MYGFESYDFIRDIFPSGKLDLTFKAILFPVLNRQILFFLKGLISKGEMELPEK
jgi:hypothetical protein